ncbi:MAG TPA: GAF domain-containing protein [Anaerolineales bacterium]|nr:GAF domain-containing protein [Anaerolineales bacterium]
MAKTQKPNEDEKIVKDNIEKRFKNMFSGENEPLSNMSLKEAESLKARVAELETLLTEQKAAPLPPKPATPTAEPAVQSLSGIVTEKAPADQQEQKTPAALEKNIGLWVTGISAAVGLAFFGAALYIAYVLQGGVLDLPDKALQPLTLLMFLVNLIGFQFVRRNRILVGLWGSYLINVILGPVVVVLVMANIYTLMGIYLVVFSLIFITLIFPKTSRLRASLVAVGAALVITGIEVWHPEFRDSTNHIQSVTPIITGAAALAILALVTVIRQLRNPRIQSRLTILLTTFMVLVLLVISLLIGVISRQRIEAGALTELQGTSRSTAANVSTWLELNKSALQQLTLLPEIASMNPEQQRPALQAMAKAYPYMYLVSTTDLRGFNVARNDNGKLTDYSDREWFQSAKSGAPVSYQTLIGRTTGQPALVVSMPIKDVAGRIVGVAMFAADLTDLARETQVARLGEGGFTFLVDANNQTLSHPDPAVTAELRDMSDYPPVAALRQGQQDLIITTDENGQNWRGYGTILDNGWAVIAQRPESEILAPAQQFQTVTMVMVLIGGMFLLVLTWVTIRRTLRPIEVLTRTASAIAAGDLNRVAEVNTRDEMGVLASTFNTMTSQIRSLVGSLEQRVADRTHDLELAAEVGRTVTEKITHVSEMLSEAVEMIRARFDLYYTQVYLTDPSGERIILRAGTGEVGRELLERGHNLTVNSTSLNGRAAVQKQTQIVADTKENPTFLPNSLLPNTRSEMCVPLIVEGKVVGVLDMQSEQPGAFSEGNLPAFEALAGQLAIAIRNAALFMELQETRSDVEAQMSRFTEHGWEDFLNAIHLGHRIGFAFDDSRVVRIRPEALSARSNEDCLNMPIAVAGAKIGEIQLPPNLKPNELELVKVVGEQLAQHVENLRLLAQAETFRKEAELAVRRLTREGWDTYLNRANQPEIGYIYDLNQVQSLSENNKQGMDHSFKQPLVVRDETIGELKLNLPDTSAETMEIVSAVAQQLSGHLENLRLVEQNEKRAYELATVATVSTTASTLLDPDLLLQSVVDLTKERFGLYHVHIYTFEPSWNTLLLAAGAGEVGRKLVAEQHAIPMSIEQSLVARAARQREAIIVNDVDSEPGFLPNPLLPGTRAEMAVPMTVGDKLLGVFDVQADNAVGFSDEDANIYVTLAAQVGVALQNARLYVEQAAHVTQLRELDRLKSSFLANMSHELRTPLNSILGFADVIIEELDGPLTENMSNDLRLIQKNGQHLLHLINDVLDMAKIEAGRMNLNPESFKACEILEEVTSITSTLASEKHLALFIEPDTDQKVSIYADRTRLRQVMINLVNNAIKFTENGKIALKIVSLSGARILITIKDTGIGIPPDKLDAVFQEFTQVDSSTTRKAGGTGLGLPISRKLVEMHGGRLWAESTGIPGEGSTFFVELPVEARITDTVEKQER